MTAASAFSSKYDPSDDPVYMSSMMLDYYRQLLMDIYRHLVEKERTISLSIQEDPNREADHVDEGVKEELRYQDFMLQEQEDHLRKEIEVALKRIDTGDYGYCEETGEAIGVERLKACPWARYTLEIQSQKEEQTKRLHL